MYKLLSHKTTPVTLLLVDAHPCGQLMPTLLPVDAHLLSGIVQ
jgi:hypothetical protein